VVQAGASSWSREPPPCETRITTSVGTVAAGNRSTNKPWTGSRRGTLTRGRQLRRHAGGSTNPQRSGRPRKPCHLPCDRAFSLPVECAVRVRIHRCPDSSPHHMARYAPIAETGDRPRSRTDKGRHEHSSGVFRFITLRDNLSRSRVGGLWSRAEEAADPDVKWRDRVMLEHRPRRQT
jgi:hypothetical protein